MEEKPEAKPALTREALDAAFKLVAQQPMRPRHDCRYDGHVMQWNPFGFHFCAYCNVSEAEAERPS